MGSSAVRVLKDLVQLSASSTGHEIAEGIASIQRPAEIVESLARQLDDVRHPRAKACVFWLVGQYAEDTSRGTGGVVPGMASWAPDVLRRAAKSFSNDVGPFDSSLLEADRTWSIGKTGQTTDHDTSF